MGKLYMRRLLFLLSVVFSVSTIGLSSPTADARARSRSTVSARTKARAKRLFRRGNRLVKRKRYNAALKAFKKAYKLWKHPSILYNMATALALKGKTIQAAKRLRQFLKLRPMSKAQLPAVLRGVLQKTGILIVRGPDAAAAIYIDGREHGAGRVRLTVLAGRRIIEIRRGDRTVARKTIQISGDRTKTVDLTVKPRPRRRPAVLGAGKKKPKPRIRKKSTLGRLHWAYFAVSTTLAAGALAGAVYTSLLTKQAKDENRENPTPKTKEDGERIQLVANIMWGVTGGIAVGAALFAIFTRWKKEKAQPRKNRKRPAASRTSVSVTPSIYPGGAGLSVTW